MKLLIIALICVMLGVAAATTNYTQDAQAFTRPISFLENVTFHGSIDISNTSPITTEGPITGTTINASESFIGDLTGTASRVPIGTFLDTLYGLKNATTNKAQVNLSTTSGLDFGTGASQGALKIRSGLIKRTLAAGTAAAVNVTVSGMAAEDELISVTAYATAASIASMADQTSEYVIATGHLYKAAGTNSTGYQLDILWLDRTT